MGERHVAKIAPYLSRGRPEQGGTGRASRSEKRMKKLPPVMVPVPGVGQWVSAGSPQPSCVWDLRPGMGTVAGTGSSPAPGLQAPTRGFPRTMMGPKDTEVGLRTV